MEKFPQGSVDRERRPLEDPAVVAMDPLDFTWKDSKFGDPDKHLHVIKTKLSEDDLLVDSTLAVAATPVITPPIQNNENPFIPPQKKLSHFQQLERERSVSSEKPVSGKSWLEKLLGR